MLWCPQRCEKVKNVRRISKKEVLAFEASWEARERWKDVGIRTLVNFALVGQQVRTGGCPWGTG